LYFLVEGFFNDPHQCINNSQTEDAYNKKFESVAHFLINDSKVDSGVALNR
jgi:hypothetical protein